MNGRIKELDEAAQEYAGSIAGNDEDSNYVAWFNIYKEKFGELIVKECSRVIVNGGYWSGGPLGPKRQCTPPEIAQMIRQHFGVKE